METGWRGLTTAGVVRFLPVFMARLGASSLAISSLTSLPALFLMFATLPAGKYTEKKQNHVQMTALARGLYYVSFVILAMLPFFFGERILPVVIVGLWCVQIIPRALMNPAFMSVLGSAIPPEQRPAVNGGRLALSGAVEAVAVAIIGKLLDSGLLQFPMNYQLVFLISVAGGLISLYFFRQIKTSNNQARVPAPRQSARQRLIELIGPLIREPDFRKYLAATFFIRWGLIMPIALYSIYWVRYLDASDTVIGLRATAETISLIAGYYVFGRVASRSGHRNVLILSAIGLGFYPIMTAFVPNQYWLIPIATVRGFFMGGLSISFFEGVLSIAPPDRRPSYASVQTATANLAFFVGPFLGSLLMEYLNIQIALGVAGGLHMIGAFLCWRLGVGKPTAGQARAGLDQAAS